MSLFAGLALVGSARPISFSVTFCATQQDPSQRRDSPLSFPLPASPTSAIVGFFDHDVSRETIARPHDFDAPSRPPGT